MTNEEALVKVKGYLTDYLSLEDADEIDEIIEALKQQPCEDCVKREDVRNGMIKYGFLSPDMTVTEFVEDLPSVTPSYNLIKTELKPCEDCISREAVRRILANQRDELIKLHTVNPKDNPKADAMAYGVNWSLNTLMELPSVTPSIPDVENNFNLGYNCGYADAMCDISESEG